MGHELLDQIAKLEQLDETQLLDIEGMYAKNFVKNGGMIAICTQKSFTRVH